MARRYTYKKREPKAGFKNEFKYVRTWLEHTRAVEKIDFIKKQIALIKETAKRSGFINEMESARLKQLTTMLKQNDKKRKRLELERELGVERED